MSLVTTAAIVLAEETEHGGSAMGSTWGFGLFAFVMFLVAAFVTWTFRDVAQRHSHKKLPGVHGETEAHAPIEH